MMNLIGFKIKMKILNINIKHYSVTKFESLDKLLGGLRGDISSFHIEP